MKKRNRLAEFYTKYFATLGLERTALFETVKQVYGGQTVLYPGCYIHVTPSFYFQHVVYVDKSEASQQGFADLAAAGEFVSSRKHYRQNPYIRFIAQDFTLPLPLPEQSFDLLFSLYAGGIALACSRYLKVGGFLLSNNHHDDAAQAAHSGMFSLVGTMPEKDPTHDNPITDSVTSFISGNYYVFQRVR